jgi:hypothetical protein
VFGVSLFGAMLVLPLYYRVVRGQSALDAVAAPLAHAFAGTFWWAVGLTALALFPPLMLPREPAGSRGSAPAAEAL